MIYKIYEQEVMNMLEGFLFFLKSAVFIRQN